MFGLLYLYRCLPRPLQFIAKVMAVCFVIAILVYSLSVVSHLLPHPHDQRTQPHQHQ
jgi:hypothetical protein